jgi:PAS domain S-box-containing protein
MARWTRTTIHTERFPVHVVFIWIIVATLWLPSALYAVDLTVAVFDSDSPVISVDDRGDPTGFFPDILSEIAVEVGIDIEFVVVDSFRVAYERVVAGEIDILPATVYTEERARDLDFNEVPFLAAWGQLGVRIGEDFPSILDLRDSRIGIVENDQNGINFVQLMTAFDIPVEFVYFENHHEVSQAIRDGTIDAGVFFNSWFVSHEGVEPSSIVFSPTQAYIAAARNRHRALLAEIDRHLRRVKEERDSYYFDTLNRWFSPASSRNVPRWVWITGALSVGIACIAVGFVLVLRREVSRATRRLRESRETYRTVADFAYGWEFWIAPDGTFRYVSPNTIHVTGYAADEFVKDPGLARRMIVPEDRAMWDEHVSRVEARSPHENETLLFRATHADGSIRWMEHRCTSIVDDSGRFAGHRGTNIDVTERIEHERSLQETINENRALMNEIHHRVYNNLQVIYSLISIHQSSLDDPVAQRAFASIANRVYAFGALHESVYWSHSYGRVPMRDYLNAVIANIRDSVDDPRPISTTLHADPIDLDIDRALPCGLIVNEAVTNAFNHAFPSDGGGDVRVELERSHDSMVQLTISDSGVGSVSDSKFEGSVRIGITLIRTLARQLGGELEIRSNSGFQVCVSFPV